MKAVRFLGIVCLLFALMVAEKRLHSSASTPPALARTVSPGTIHSYGQVPLSFEPNRGQADGRVSFFARAHGYTLFLTSTEAVFAFSTHSHALPRTPGAPAGRLTTQTVQALLTQKPQRDRVIPIRMSFAGANPQPAIVPVRQLPGIVNYFIGNDPSRWHTGIPTYAAVEERDVYPGVNLRYYGRGKELEYDWLLQPGADPSRIRLQVMGTALRIDRQGNLVLGTGAVGLRQGMPVAYQQIGRSRQVIHARYVLSGNQIGFRLGAYSHRLPLVIDPPIAYLTTLGGSGDDYGYAAAVDGAGNAYIAGDTTSTNFPTQKPLQSASKGGSDQAFVTKLDSKGNLLYSSYLGGSTFDYASGLAVDASGNAYVTGSTLSKDFPTATAYQSQLKGAVDAFVAKLSPDGASLLYSTYLGGDRIALAGRIAIDSAGDTFVTGGTTSDDFPTVHAAQPAYAGAGTTCKNSKGQQIYCFDAFVTKFSSDGKSLVYSTYLGGSEDEIGFAIAVGTDGSAAVTGYTTSPNFPTVKPIQAHYGGGTQDAFISLLDPSGALVFSTYRGGAGADGGSAIAFGAAGTIYTAINTTSPSFPAAGAASVHSASRAAPRQSKPSFDDIISATKVVSGQTPQEVGQTKVSSSLLSGSGSDQDVADLAATSNGTVAAAGDMAEPEVSSTFFDTGTGGKTAKIYEFVVDVAPGPMAIYDLEFCGPWVLPLKGGTQVYGVITGHYYRVTSPGISQSVEEDVNWKWEAVGSNCLRASTDSPSGGLEYGTSYHILVSGSRFVFPPDIVDVRPSGPPPDHKSLPTFPSQRQYPRSGELYEARIGLAQRGGIPKASARQTQPATSHTESFVLALKDSAGQLRRVSTTYLVGNGDVHSGALALDGKGNAYLAGFTNATNLPGSFPWSFSGTKPAPLGPQPRPFAGGPDDAFIARITNLLAPPAAPKTVKCTKNQQLVKGKCKCKKGYVLKKGKCVKKK